MNSQRNGLCTDNPHLVGSALRTMNRNIAETVRSADPTKLQNYKTER
jgi:hypothetical protein